MAQKWNTVKDKNGNTFVKTGSNYWPVLGKGNGLSYAGESTAAAPKPAKATAAGVHLPVAAHRLLPRHSRPQRQPRRLRALMSG